MTDCSLRDRRLRVPPSGFAACIALLVLAASCDHGGPGIETDRTTMAGARSVRLMDFELPLHFAKERRGLGQQPLVLFATGDGGWRGLDQSIFEAFIRLGCPTAGFSAKDYLAHLDKLPTATPEHLGKDYAKLIAEARDAMEVGDTTPVVLSGFSRGAALSVIAAGDPGLQRSLGGVLVMGLDDVEEHVRRPVRAGATSIDMELMRPYAYLNALGALRLSLVQSTHDRFLDAEQARKLFGPDDGQRRLRAIDAQSHTFGGSREQFLEEIGRSLDWLERASPANPSETGSR
jgi:Bacterial virulence protein (VirJ)